jgi:outer membrane protein assembly factor BamB
MNAERLMRLLTSVPIALLALSAVAAGQDWPQFRGPARDGAFQGHPTMEPFSSSGPERVWDRQVGSGFSAPAVARGRLVLFHRQGGQEVVEALRATDGKGIWKFSYDTRYRDDFGFDNGPRATPVIEAGRVFTFGAQGTLHCLDFETGHKVWAVDTHGEFGVRKGFFGAASTPLVVDGRVLANVGGADGAGIVALDAETGETLWMSTDHEASYSSPVAARLDGRTMAVFFTREGLAALDPSTGAVVYERRWRSRSHASINAATPIVMGDIVFLSASYGTGSIAMKLCNRKVEELWSGEDVIDNHYSSCVLAGGTLFGFHGRQEYGQSFRAADLPTGKVLWSQDGVRAGSVSRVGDRLLLLLESGELLMVAASRDRFEVLARAQVLARETRAFPAIADGLFFARDQDTLVCLRLWKE